MRVLTTLLEEDGYGLGELHAACEIAISLGARGPELIPHVVGQETEPSEEVGERLREARAAEQERWRGLAEKFDASSESEQEALVERARQSNPILAKRAPNHPLVRAAAIALFGEG